MTALGMIPGMLRILCCLLVAAPLACHGYFGGRTTDEDTELNNFAEARQRAATYYDGGDYIRAAAQFKKALDYRPKHVATRLGYAYSLMYSKLPSNLMRAQEEFEKIRVQRDKRQEVKRVFGLALTHRTLAELYQRRSRDLHDKGRIKPAEEDDATARQHAVTAIGLFKKIFEIDAALATERVAPLRVSASLTPEAHAGIAHCEIMLVDAKNLHHVDLAIEHIDAFSKVAANARRFWSQRHERLLVIDPLREGQEGDPNAAAVASAEKELYEARIRRTVDEEVAIRRALLHTFLYLNWYKRAIDECNRILDLDPTVDEVLFLRGRAFALLDPPDYRSAVKDLKEYRARQDLSRLTEQLVGLNRRIKEYERKLKEQQAKGLN